MGAVLRPDIQDAQEGQHQVNFILTALASGTRRSVFAVGWRAVREAHILEHPYCAACGYAPLVGSNDVHHIEPRHVNPSRITDPTNLITLCRKYDCHLRFGHFGDYRRFWNPQIDVVLHGSGFRMRVAERKHKNEVLGNG